MWLFSLSVISLKLSRVRAPSPKKPQLGLSLLDHQKEVSAGRKEDENDGPKFNNNNNEKNTKENEKRRKKEKKEKQSLSSFLFLTLCP